MSPPSRSLSLDLRARPAMPTKPRESSRSIVPTAMLSRATVRAAPPLQVFANDPTTYNEDRLRTSLRQPHWPMGQFRLSASDIDNILAFIAELRRNAN